MWKAVAIAVVLWLALCACGGGATPAVKGAAAPAQARPEVVRTGGFDFGSRGLPAITADGRQVVYTYMGEDNVRGRANFSVVVRDVDRDQVVEQKTLLTVKEAEDEPDEKALETRVEAANAWLGKMALTPMAAGGLRVVYDEPAFAVYELGAGNNRLLVSRRMTAWSAPRKTKRCPFPARLGGAWSSPDRRVVLVLVSYAGDDKCPEPDSEAHVVRIR